MEKAFVISEVALTGLIFVFNLLQINIVVSIAFTASFLVMLIYLSFSGVSRRVNAILFVLIIITGINVVVNGFMSTGAVFNFEYFKKLLFFFTSVIFFELATRVSITERHMLIIKSIIVAMTIFLLFDYYLFGNRTMFGRYLTLGFNNPNFTAMWLMHLGMFLLFFMFQSEYKVFKCFCVLMIAFSLFLIIQTGNRSTLVVMVFFIVMVIIGVIKRDYKLHKITMILIVLAPFIFYLIYQALISSPLINQLFQFAISEGKGLDSRAYVWNYATRLLEDNGWIIGNYAELHFNNVTGMLQMHNSHLDTFVSYGIVPFFLFLLLHYRILDGVNNRMASFSQYIAFCSFMSVIMLGVFEAGIYAGCTGLNYLSGTFLILASTDYSKPSQYMKKRICWGHGR